MFGFFKKSNDITLKFVKSGHPILYINVDGYFEFRGTIYFKSQGVSRSLFNIDKSFTKDIMEKYSDEFSTASSKKISSLEVQPLKIVR